jgi:DNA-binding beta-propeller fold protein YncE
MGKLKRISFLFLLIIVGATAYYMLNQNGQTIPYTNNQPQSNKTDRGPFDIAPAPVIVLNNDLLQEIESRKGHDIGYIANDYEKAIYVIDLSSEQYLGKIVFDADEPRGGPSYIAITPDSRYFIVTRAEFSNDILVFDSRSFELVKQIPGGKYNDYIVVNPVRNEAYILSGNYQDTSVYVLDLQSLSISRTFEIGYELGTADISPDGDTLYITTSAGVSYVDISSGEIVREVLMDTTYWKRVVVNPANGYIYVVNNPDIENRWPSIQVFNTSGESINRIENLTAETTWNGGITSLAITPSGDLLFSVSQMNELTIINATTSQKISNLSVKQPNYYGNPSWIYFNPQGTKVYFIYWGAVPIDSPGPDSPSIVCVMDLTSYRFSNTIRLDEHAGAGPMAILK